MRVVLQRGEGVTVSFQTGNVVDRDDVVLKCSKAGILTLELRVPDEAGNEGTVYNSTKQQRPYPEDKLKW